MTGDEPFMEETPSVRQGANYKKNRRANQAQKRKRALEREMRIKIDTRMPFYRELRDVERKAAKKETALKYLHPWMRNNLAYRLQEREVPSASLLGIPTEIRQRIFDLSLDETIPCKVNEYMEYMEYTHRRWRSARMQALYKKIGILCRVSPVFRMEMEYVSKEKTKQFLEKAEEWDGKKKKNKAELPRWDKNLPPDKKKKGKVVNAKVTKMRPQKCWKCEERHRNNGKDILLLFPHLFICLGCRC